MKIKTFIADDPKNVETNVNEWLHTNKVEIHHIGQSQSERSGRFVFVITVFYIPVLQVSNMN